MVKNPSASAGDMDSILGWEDPLEKEIATHSSILAWRIPMDRGTWWAAVHGILQVRILEWVAFPFSRGSSQPRMEPRSPALALSNICSLGSCSMSVHNVVFIKGNRNIQECAEMKGYILIQIEWSLRLSSMYLPGAHL